MRRDKNVFWGIMFLVIAAFIIASAMGVFGKIGFWTLVFTPFLIAWFITSIRNLSWGGMLFSLAFFAILYDKMLGIENLTPWPVLLAAGFGSIGLNMIFGKHSRWKKSKWSNGERQIGGISGQCFEDENSFRSEVCFSTATKYITCQALRDARIGNTFGTTVVYFDDAILENGTADVRIDNAFGTVVLYIPKEWHVLINIDRAFGNCKAYGICAKESSNVLHVNGDTSFGGVEVHYI